MTRGRTAIARSTTAEIERLISSSFPNGAVEVAAIDVAPDSARAMVALLYNPGPDPYEAVQGVQLADGRWVAGNERYGLGAGLMTLPSAESEHEFVDVPYLLGRVGDKGVRTAVIRYRDTMLRCPVRVGLYLGVFWEDAGPPDLGVASYTPDATGPLTATLEFVPYSFSEESPHVERYE